MDAAQALAELTELSSQVVRAVVLEEGGEVLAATDDDPAEAQALAGAALALVAGAAELRSAAADVRRVEVELADGGLFVLREGGRTIAATTGPGPTAGLVAYDLRTCLHAIEQKPKRKRARGSRSRSRRRRPSEEAAPARRSPSRSRSGRGATFVGVRGPHERASVSFADGSEVVLEPGSPEFERLASVARPVLPA